MAANPAKEFRHQPQPGVSRRAGFSFALMPLDSEAHNIFVAKSATFFVWAIASSRIFCNYLVNKRRRDMTTTPKTIKSISEKIADADARGGKYLADANEAAELGNHEKAEKLYATGQYWLDRSNKLRGAGY